MDGMTAMTLGLSQWWDATPSHEIAWLTIGLLAQLMFSARFIVQWLASESAGRSVMPVSFWYLSLAGGVLLLAYALYRLDPVFILGQLMGLLVYGRNLQLIRGSQRDTPVAR
jgi:lipid-A-disaccharide synthase-like uncharacterized protein